MKQEPLIFVLDLDGTIIGDCIYQLILHNIDEIAKKNTHRTKFNKPLSDCYNTNSKLIRPYFKYFVNSIKKTYPGSLFYIYTASEKSWAQKEIGFIEKTHNFKFNRPLFTRDDCIIDSHGNYKKSVNKILPMIKKKHKSMMIQKSKILVIDNNETFIDASNFIHCPTYDGIQFCDIWENMKKELLSIYELKNMIIQLIMSNKVCKYNSFFTNPLCDNSTEMKHKWYYKKYKKINKVNKKFKNDMFWKKLANTIIEKKITSFDKQNIQLLKKHSCS